MAGLIQSERLRLFLEALRHATAASSLMQAEAVTADGKLRTVNAGRDPDLFWGLKGGGGEGLSAVVTKVTLETHELPRFLRWFCRHEHLGRQPPMRISIAAFWYRFVDFYADDSCSTRAGAGASPSGLITPAGYFDGIRRA